jgi:hypothetical protein
MATLLKNELCSFFKTVSVETLSVVSSRTADMLPHLWKMADTICGVAY